MNGVDERRSWMAHSRAGSILLFFMLPLLAGQPLVGIGSAREASLRTHDDASMLAQVSQAVLADEPYEEEARAVPGLMAPVWQEETPPVDQKLIEAQLNAVRAEQRELEALCSYARKAHADDTCFLEQLKESCDRKASRLQSQYEALRAIRGDRRKQTTKFFASINRTRREIWHGLGPVGRRIVRNLTNDVVSVVASQGKITGQVFKVLLRKHVQHELKTVALERVVRKAGGAGGPGSACDEAPGVAGQIQGETQAGDDSCAGDYSWIDEYWEIVQQTLIEERRNCQPSAAFQYRQCLENKVQDGLCMDAAIEACQVEFDRIPSNDSGGTVAWNAGIFHGAIVEQRATITYPSGGGTTQGDFYYKLYDEVTQCTITITGSGVTGVYHPETCSIEGTLQLTIRHEGMLCVSVCGIAPSSPAACPVTKSGSTSWEAEVKDGVLSGGVGGKACDPHCFGFRAPPP